MYYSGTLIKELQLCTGEDAHGAKPPLVSVLYVKNSHKRLFDVVNTYSRCMGCSQLNKTFTNDRAK